MIVAVGGGKGGVGKSTVALNLASELEAVLVDGDLTAGAHPSTGGPILPDVLAERVAPEAALTEFGSVRVIPAGETLTDARAADLSRFEDTVRSLDRRFGTVVVDCPPGLGRDVGIEMASADLVVLVTTVDETALLDCYRTRETTLDLGTPVGAVVLNEVAGSVTDDVLTRVEREYEASTQIIPRNTSTAQSIETGRPVRNLTDDKEVIKPFERVADTVEESAPRAT